MAPLVATQTSPAGYTLTEEFCAKAKVSVYRGVRESDGAPVIIKLLHEEYPTLESLARLKHEYEITKNLPVRGIAKPLALEAFGNGLALILEDDGGQSLDDFLRENPFDLVVFLEIAIQLAEIVSHLHRHKVVHRDIKPRNIIIHPQTRRVHLTDFGIATLRSLPEETATSPTQTRIAQNRTSSTRSSAETDENHETSDETSHGETTSGGALQGTLAYMSPEQTGRTSQVEDYRTDFYALGATFYEMLTGRVPFICNDALELMHAHIARAPLSPRELNAEIPEPVAEIVLKLLAKSPDERYRGAHGLKADLEICLDAWQRHLEIESFELGAHDFANELQFGAKLYGRESEIATLLQSLERVSRGACEVLLVAGYSGIGKSSLVREIQKPVVRARGIWVSGKFDQFRRGVPYASFVEAFRALVRQVLAEDEVSLRRWKSRLQEALSDQAQVVIDVIPEVELLVGAQPPVAALAPTETQNRFALVFQKFIGVWADSLHPLVLFLDDLQWADAASLKLLRVLVGDGNAPYLLVLGAYRDNEVDVSHPALLSFDEMRQNGVRVETVHLGALSPHDVTSLVADALRAQAERVAPLSNLVAEKTAGNPFFVHQLLLALEREKLLRFHPQEARWNWNLNGIRGADITDNVVDLMATKIGTLSPETQRILMIASCVGNTFSGATMALFAGQRENETRAQLWEAAREGLLLHLEDGWYKFAHDRIEQAAYSLLEELDKQQMHLQIGRLLLQSYTGLRPRERAGERVGERNSARVGERVHEQNDNIFDVVDHFNRALNYIVDTDEIDRVLELNEEAGRRAKSATAYDAALKYFTVATELLPDNAWETRHENTFALYRERSECEYLVGHTKTAQELFDLLMQRAVQLLDRVEVYRIRIQLCTILNDFAQATAIGLEGLKQLGIALPESPSQIAILREVIVARRCRGRRSVRELADAPHLADVNQQAALTLLSSLTAPLYVSGNQNLFTLVVLKMTTISLRHGNSDVSLQAYALYGVILGSGLGDYATGYEFGELALKLCEQFDNPAEQCKAYFTFPCYLSPWRKSLRFGESYFREAYRLALQAGNTVFAGYGVVNDTAYQSMSGHSLSHVRETVDKYLPFLGWTNDPNQMAMALFTRQMCACLEGRTRNGSSLSDEKVDEELLLAGLRDNAAARLWYRIAKLKVLYLNREYEGALAMSQAAETNLSPLFGTPYLAEEKFFALLSIAANYATSSTRSRAKFNRQLRRGLKQLKKWAKNSPENYGHKYLLVAAEVARLQKNPDALKLYDAAIGAAREHDALQNEAISNELAARFHLANGHEKVARSYLADARYGFLKWGALGVVAHLENEFPFLVAASSAGNLLHDSTSNESSESERLSSLDLATVVKTSQALSGEIEIEPLMRQLMQFALENAGAQKGLLLLEKNGHLFVEAQMTLDGEVDVLQSLAFDDSGDWPLAPVQYAARTREDLVLHDALTSPLFAHSAYIREHRPKSILCVPLVRQNKLVGVLYLENTLTNGAFTPKRINVLRVIAAQAAISLENALLLRDLRDTGEKLRQSHEKLAEYSRTLEAKVENRTVELANKNRLLEQNLRQITEMQDKLVMQEKMASLGALTAGVAHEIKNPLNFINNFAELSAELTTELERVLEARENNMRDVSALLGDLRQNLLDIHEHGQRADSIVNSMLLHSRGQVGERQTIDINNLVHEAVHLAYHAMRARQSDFGIAIRENYDQNIGAISVVPQDISRVVLNIVNNACYATQQRALSQKTLSQKEVLPNDADETFADETYAPQLEVTTKIDNTNIDNINIEICIRDNGTGMPRAIIDKVFNPFFTTKPPREGTGLGLSMSYDIVVQGHGGDIRIETVEGAGTEFVISLPR